jgi:hypothetical protein
MTMTAIEWLKSKCTEWNRIELTEKVDGINGWYIEASFKGSLPNHMISELRKTLKNTGGSNSVSNYVEETDGYDHFCVKIPSYKGNNNVRVSYSYVEK